MKFKRIVTSEFSAIQHSSAIDKTFIDFSMLVTLTLFVFVVPDVHWAPPRTRPKMPPPHRFAYWPEAWLGAAGVSFLRVVQVLLCIMLCSLTDFIFFSSLLWISDIYKNEKLNHFYWDIIEVWVWINPHFDDVIQSLITDTISRSQGKQKPKFWISL